MGRDGAQHTEIDALNAEQAKLEVDYRDADELPDEVDQRLGEIESALAAFVPLTPEALAAADPDTILVMTKGLESVGGIDGLVALPGVAQTTAGRERRVIAVDDTLLLSFGPRTGELVSRLSAAFAGSAG